MSSKVFFAAALLAAAIAGPSHAGPIADKGREAETLAGSGDPLKAFEALDAAAEQIWNEMPLTIRKVLLVESAEGYGIYAPRESSVYKSGESIRIYTEPVGFGYGRTALGGYEVAFDVDFAVTDESGEEVLNEEDFLAFAMPLRYRNREFQLTLAVNLDGAPAGRYTGTFLMKDKHSEKTASFSVPFEISE